MRLQTYFDLIVAHSYNQSATLKIGVCTTTNESDRSSLLDCGIILLQREAEIQDLACIFTMSRFLFEGAYVFVSTNFAIL